MVQEKELRSGNLVYRVIEDYEPLTEKKVVEWGWDIVYRIGDCVDREENYEYIPLTAEWMEEFGFVKDEHYGTYCLGDYCVSPNYGDFRFMNDPCSDALSYWITNVKWVHQLQNLYFAITGKELERKTV